MAVRMRQLEERQVEREIKSMQWSPTMDILAIEWKAGSDVSLYRLNWQRLWSASPPADGSQSSSLVWRPDGKLLAVGYTSGHVSIFDVESHIPVCTHQIEGNISSLAWTTHTAGDISSTTADTFASNKQQPSAAAKEMPPGLSKEGWEFLTSFPSLTNAYSGTEDKEECQKLHDGGLITLLIVGTETGFVHLFMNGFLHCAKIDMNAMVREPVHLEHVTASTDHFAIFSAICCRPKQNQEMDSSGTTSSTKVIFFRVPLLATCIEELQIITKFYCTIKGILNYMSDTLKQISEAWESVLLEMDSKLESYAKKLPEDGLAADFLELLMFGVPSPDLEAFLRTELNEKGLKKFDHSIEVSYTNIQRLVLLYLNTVSESLSFHLAELVGFIRSSKKFEIIGVQEDAIIEAQQHSASFWCKGVEVQQVLHESLKAFRAFFKWLSVELRRMSDLSLADDLGKVSHRDVQFISEFLSTFSAPATLTEGGETRCRYLEQVGQYLKGDTIYKPLDRKNNPWLKFLQENPDIKNLPEIIYPDETSSPIKEFDNLKKSVDSIFEAIDLSSADNAQYAGNLELSRTEEKCSLEYRQFACSASGKIFGLVMMTGSELEPRPFSDRILFYQLDMKAGDVSVKALWLSLPPAVDSHWKLIDCQFYTIEMISLLLETTQDSEEKQQLIRLSYSLMEPHLHSLPVSTFCPIFIDPNSLALVPSMSVYEFSDESCHRDLEHMLAIKFSVSGPRKVASFLFRNKRRIRIYDMEAEEEDLDDDTLGTSGVTSDLNTSS